MSKFDYSRVPYAYILLVNKENKKQSFLQKTHKSYRYNITILGGTKMWHPNFAKSLEAHEGCHTYSQEVIDEDSVGTEEYSEDSD